MSCALLARLHRHPLEWHFPGADLNNALHVRAGWLAGETETLNRKIGFLTCVLSLCSWCHFSCSQPSELRAGLGAARSVGAGSAALGLPLWGLPGPDAALLLSARTLFPFGRSRVASRRLPLWAHSGHCGPPGGECLRFRQRR